MIATFTYDGDGNRVKSVMGSETTVFIGGYYEVTNPGSGQTVTKYYFAGAQRVAMRKTVIPQSETLTYLLGGHLGSTSLAVTGAEVIETRYKPCPLRFSSGMLREGEVRFATPSKTLPTRYSDRPLHRRRTLHAPSGAATGCPDAAPGACHAGEFALYP